MKLNVIKVLFAIAIGALLGYICKIIATDKNQWYSLAVASISIIGALIAAFASYPNVSGPRQGNTKLTAWIMAAVIVVANLIFAFCDYNSDTYIVVLGLLLVIDLFIVYILARNSSRQIEKQ